MGIASDDKRERIVFWLPGIERSQKNLPIGINHAFHPDKHTSFIKEIHARVRTAKKPMTTRTLEELYAKSPTMLALLDDFRKFDWAEEYKYPTVILAQMNQLLAECRDDQPVVTP